MILQEKVPKKQMDDRAWDYPVGKSKINELKKKVDKDNNETSAVLSRTEEAMPMFRNNDTTRNRRNACGRRISGRCL